MFLIFLLLIKKTILYLLVFIVLNFFSLNSPLLRMKYISPFAVIKYFSYPLIILCSNLRLLISIVSFSFLYLSCDDILFLFIYNITSFEVFLRKNTKKVKKVNPRCIQLLNKHKKTVE